MWRHIHCLPTTATTGKRCRADDGDPDGFGKATVMSLLLGFDLDGVFADFRARLGAEVDPGSEGERNANEAAELESTVGVTPAPRVIEVPSATAPRDKGARRRAWSRLAATENFWETLTEIEAGSVGQLAALARERRWEVIFLTSRPDAQGDSVQVQSQRWLEAKGFALPSVFVTTGSRGRIASALSLDLVVDDSPENCLDVATESEARAILVWRDVTESVPASARRLGIGSVSSIGECLAVLDEADRVKRGGGGVRDAFRRLFRMTGAASTGR